MVSVADIPLAGCHFPGCIAFVYFGGKEYRLATYLGVKILRFGEREVLLKQGNMLLYLRVQGHGGQKLKAPEKGSMDRLEMCIRDRGCTLGYHEHHNESETYYIPVSYTHLKKVSGSSGGIMDPCSGTQLFMPGRIAGYGKHCIYIMVK